MVKLQKIPKHWFGIALIGIALLASLLLALSVSKSKPIIIQPQNEAETRHWKSYNNDQLHFSFKYPDGLLSNFSEQATASTFEAIRGQIEADDKRFEAAKNNYNVVFEAKAEKYGGSIKEFLKDKKLPETEDLPRIPLRFGTMKGEKVTNVDLKAQKVYFSYYLLTQGGFIYNFSLVSDDPLLIQGNEPLIEKIISTITFNP